jgi:hypothetical protein
MDQKIPGGIPSPVDIRALWKDKQSPACRRSVAMQRALEKQEESDDPSDSSPQEQDKQSQS